jgi:hypothetical protein
MGLRLSGHFALLQRMRLCRVSAKDRYRPSEDSDVDRQRDSDYYRLFRWPNYLGRH